MATKSNNTNETNLLQVLKQSAELRQEYDNSVKKYEDKLSHQSKKYEEDVKMLKSEFNNEIEKMKQLYQEEVKQKQMMIEKSKEHNVVLNEMTNLKKDKQSLEKEIENLKSLVNKLRDQAESDKIQLNEERKLIESKYDEKYKDHTNKIRQEAEEKLKEAIGKKEDDISRIMSDFDVELRRMSDKVNDNEKIIEFQNDKIKSLQNEISVHINDNTNLKEQIVTLKNENVSKHNSLQEQTISMESKLVSAMEKINSLNLTVKMNLEEKEILMIKIHESQKTMKQLELHISQLKEIVNAYKSGFNEIGKTLPNFESNVKSLETIHQTLVNYFANEIKIFPGKLKVLLGKYEQIIQLLYSWEKLIIKQIK